MVELVKNFERPVGGDASVGFKTTSRAATKSAWCQARLRNSTAT
jgi:hypothetical protein